MLGMKREDVGEGAIGFDTPTFGHGVRDMVAHGWSQPERLRNELFQWVEGEEFSPRAWDIVHQEVMKVGGPELSRAVFQDEQTKAFHRLGAVIQSEAKEALRRLAPDVFDEFFGLDEEENEVNASHGDARLDSFRPLEMESVVISSAIERPDPMPIQVALSELELEIAPMKTQTVSVDLSATQNDDVEGQASVEGSEKKETQYYQRVREDKVFAQRHLATTTDNVLKLLKQCQRSEAAAFVEGRFLSEIIGFRTRLAQDKATLEQLLKQATHENADHTIEMIRGLIVERANTFESLRLRGEPVLQQAQVERVSLRRLQVLAQLNEERETYDWLNRSAQRQTHTLAGAMNHAWQSIVEHFTDRAPTPKAIEFHARRQLASVRRLRADLVQVGLPQRTNWQQVEERVVQVEKSLTKQAFPPALKRMLNGMLSEFKEENHALSEGLEGGARFAGMAAGESAKYLLSLSLPGFIPLIHAGWAALEEVSFQMILDGHSLNPGEIYWKGLVGSLGGLLAGETRTLGEAFADTVLRSRIVQRLCDDTVRAFSQVFASHAVDTVKDAFILEPIRAVFRRDDAGDLVVNTENLGRVLMEEIEKKVSLHEIGKTLIGAGLDSVK